MICLLFCKARAKTQNNSKILFFQYVTKYPMFDVPMNRSKTKIFYTLAEGFCIKIIHKLKISN